MKTTNELNKKNVGAGPVSAQSSKARQNRGITLIALVITIIVMLILVSVTISMAVNGGLFEYAGEAVSKTQEALDAEKELSNGRIQVGGKWYDSIDDYLKGNELIFSYEEAEKDENGCLTVNAKYESGENTAVIPKGFKVSEKDGEKSIEQGLVIVDADGNEFVWVPCTTDVNDESGATLYAQDKKYNDGTEASKQYYYTSYSDWTDNGGNTASVEKYGGFYVGRYEAGIPSDATFFGNTDGATYTYSGRNVTTYVPVSKANNPSWNYISQVNAKTVSEAMYAESTSVQSRLIDSYAWDTIVNWMESENNGIATNSTNYGNYVNSTISLTDALYAEHTLDYSTWAWKSIASQYKKGALEITARSQSGEQTLYELATGSTENTKVLNIYDMAGNMWEWTTEVGNHDAGTSSTQYAVFRGGSFNGDGSDSPVSHRNGNNTSSPTSINIGFRVVLYIK